MSSSFIDPTREDPHSGRCYDPVVFLYVLLCYIYVSLLEVRQLICQSAPEVGDSTIM